ncbi:hypothetical protein D9M72_541560 [compost metagenome]
MIKDVAGKPLPAGPGKGPERRRQADLFQFLLRLQPELVRFRRQMQPDFRYMRRRQNAGVGADEAFGIGFQETLRA